MMLRRVLAAPDSNLEKYDIFEKASKYLNSKPQIDPETVADLAESFSLAYLKLQQTTNLTFIVRNMPFSGDGAISCYHALTLLKHPIDKSHLEHLQATSWVS